MQPGVYSDLTNAEYHGGAGVNKGLLDFVARSPLHAKAVIDAANDKEPTAAQVFGTAFHTLLLEPNSFAENYVCELTRDDAPDAIADRAQLVAMVEELNADRLAKLPTGGTKAEQVERILAAVAEQGLDGQPSFAALTRDQLESMKGADLRAELDLLNSARPGKLPTGGSMHELAAILAEHGRPVRLWADVRARWDAENEGLAVLSVETFDRLQAMARAVADHPAALALFTGCEGRAEMSVYWTDPATGELCRCRPDWWRADGVLVDLKTTNDASPEGFAKSLANYRYHVQAPWYLDGTQAAYDAGHTPEGWERPRAFVFVAVESAAPHAVAAYVLDPESLDLGRAQYRDNLDTLAECKRTGRWPGYGDRLQQLGVPAWYLARQAAQGAGA